MHPDPPAISRGVSIAAVGDLMFDTRLRQPRLFFQQPEVAACLPNFASAFRMPFVNTDESRRWLACRGSSTYAIEITSHAYRSTPLDPPAPDSDPDFPFRALTDHLRAADLVFGNLECPLSNQGRPTANDQCYCASPAFAAAMARASFRVVSFANNHAMDYGEAAFLDTVEALERNGIAAVGAGTSLQRARRPAIFDCDGLRIAFLGYTMIGPDWAFAVNGESGVAPLNPLFAAQDIEAVRLDVDLIVLSVHWGGEAVARPSLRLVEFAHQLVDCGADVILGHHPHVPGAIEVYRGRPILYSLGNFCFGHDHTYWGDNIMARLTADDEGIRRIELVPLAREGRYQPFLMANGRVETFLDELRRLSEPFGTRIALSGGRGVITSGGRR